MYGAAMYELDRVGGDQLIGEIITALSKEHAYAIVVEAHSAEAVLPILTASPKLTAFFAVRELLQTRAVNLCKKQTVRKSHL